MRHADLHKPPGGAYLMILSVALCSRPASSFQIGPPMRRLSLCLVAPLMMFAAVSSAASSLAASSPATPSPATPCADLVEEGASYTVCAFDARQASIRLFLRDAAGAPYGDFSHLADSVAGQGADLIFAMNAGMYDDDFAPVGLYVENGHRLHEANVQAGAGNFHLRPNGVFWVDGVRAGVTETGRFLKSRAHPAFATQSGPMLLINGRVNPHIHASGVSEKYRNGVGVSDRGGSGCLDSSPRILSGSLPGFTERGAVRFYRGDGRA
jgi:uncharacterized protein YigE (DUF2233 family)